MLRESYLSRIDKTFEAHSVCALLGPRQCGKTTIANQYANRLKGTVHIFDLEDLLDLAKLQNPKLILEPLEGLIIIDEIQRQPELFPILRVLVDKYNKRFLILGVLQEN